ncbi:hypothetical protein B0I35DRAFT_442389, partial [Stachybotrys elegans]
MPTNKLSKAQSKARSKAHSNLNLQLSGKSRLPYAVFVEEPEPHFVHIISDYHIHQRAVKMLDIDDVERRLERMRPELDRMAKYGKMPPIPFYVLAGCMMDAAALNGPNLALTMTQLENLCRHFLARFKDGDDDDEKTKEDQEEAEGQYQEAEDEDEGCEEDEEREHERDDDDHDGQQTPKTPKSDTKGKATGAASVTTPSKSPQPLKRHRKDEQPSSPAKRGTSASGHQVPLASSAAATPQKKKSQKKKSKKKGGKGKKVYHSKKQRDLCLERDGNACVVTGEGKPQVCHIIPFTWNNSTGNVEKTGKVIEGVRSLFGDGFMDAIPGLEDDLRGHDKLGSSDRSWNMVPLNPKLHASWGNASWGFEPEPEVTMVNGKYRVVCIFRWMPQRDKEFAQKLMKLSGDDNDLHRLLREVKDWEAGTTGDEKDGNVLKQLPPNPPTGL